MFTSVKAAAFLVNPTKRSFARVPMIKFLGPRSKTDKHVGAYASAAGHGAGAATDASQADKKALSKNCELEFADIPAARWARLEFSQLEQDTINQGTNEIEMDWHNIRL